MHEQFPSEVIQGMCPDPFFLKLFLIQNGITLDRSPTNNKTAPVTRTYAVLVFCLKKKERKENWRQKIKNKTNKSKTN